VSNLSLRVSSKYLHISYFWNPLFLLLLVHHSLASVQKHCVMEPNRTLSELGVCPMDQMRLMFDKPLFFSVFIGGVSSHHQVFHLLLSRHVVEFVCLMQFWVLVLEIARIRVPLQVRVPDEVNGLTFVVSVVSFFLQRRIDDFVFPASFYF
jgi:hypothetical protein